MKPRKSIGQTHLISGENVLLFQFETQRGSENLKPIQTWRLAPVWFCKLIEFLQELALQVFTACTFLIKTTFSVYISPVLGVGLERIV